METSFSFHNQNTKEISSFKNITLQKTNVRNDTKLNLLEAEIATTRNKTKARLEPILEKSGEEWATPLLKADGDILYRSNYWRYKETYYSTDRWKKKKRTLDKKYHKQKKEQQLWLVKNRNLYSYFPLYDIKKHSEDWSNRKPICLNCKKQGRSRKEISFCGKDCQKKTLVDNACWEKGALSPKEKTEIYLIAKFNEQKRKKKKPKIKILGLKKREINPKKVNEQDKQKKLSRKGVHLLNSKTRYWRKRLREILGKWGYQIEILKENERTKKANFDEWIKNCSEKKKRRTKASLLRSKECFFVISGRGTDPLFNYLIFNNYKKDLELILKNGRPLMFEKKIKEIELVIQQNQYKWDSSLKRILLAKRTKVPYKGSQWAIKEKEPNDNYPHARSNYNGKYYPAVPKVINLLQSKDTTAGIRMGEHGGSNLSIIDDDNDRNLKKGKITKQEHTQYAKNLDYLINRWRKQRKLSYYEQSRGGKKVHLNIIGDEVPVAGKIYGLDDGKSRRDFLGEGKYSSHPFNLGKKIEHLWWDDLKKRRKLLDPKEGWRNKQYWVGDEVSFTMKDLEKELNLVRETMHLWKSNLWRGKIGSWIRRKNSNVKNPHVLLEMMIVEKERMIKIGRKKRFKSKTKWRPNVGRVKSACFCSHRELGNIEKVNNAIVEKLTSICLKNGDNAFDVSYRTEGTNKVGHFLVNWYQKEESERVKESIEPYFKEGKTLPSFLLLMGTKHLFFKTLCLIG